MIAANKILLFILFIVIQFSAHAQCAMCKAVLESDLQSGGSMGKGINDGIMYLMLIPYILIASVGYFIYRHYKKNKLVKKV
jgi:hypothetical protein